MGDPLVTMVVSIPNHHSHGLLTMICGTPMTSETTGLLKWEFQDPKMEVL